MRIYKTYLKLKIIILKLLKKKTTKTKIQLYKARGYNIGNNCYIFTNLSGSEPYLVTIGNNVTISTNVTLLTHDNSIIKMGDNSYTDIFGEIIIGNNCFIGANSILLPGVKLAEGTIVAAGSVVTKSIKTKNMIIGGNPAKIISTTEEYIKKNKKYGVNCKGLNSEQRKKLINDNKDKLIVKNEI